MTTPVVSNEGAIPSGAGLRRTTTASLAAQNYARQYGQATRITRTAALRVAKKVAPALGLKGTTIALIDILFAFSKSQDWTTQDVVPVVWPSNDVLSERLGVEVWAVRYHLRQLVEAGLIAYSDSPTYRRWGRRDEGGVIVEAYGINLSPIAVRFAELTELVGAAEAEAAEKKDLRNRFTVVRKEVESLIASAHRRGLSGDWGHARARLDVIREKRCRDIGGLEGKLADLEVLQSDLEDMWDQAVEGSVESINLTTTPVGIPLHTTTVQHSDSVNSRPEFGVGHSPDKSDTKAAYGRRAQQGKPVRNSGAVQHKNTLPLDDDDDIRILSMPLVQSACPDLEDMVPGTLGNWASLRNSGPDLCVAANINPQVWHEACDVLGPDRAIAAVAVTVQKAKTGLVDNPGGYLRTLVQRGQDGRLHISRSLFAMAGNTHETGSGKADIPATVAFPDEGTVSYGPWSDIIRQHTPDPTPDVDHVAGAFRRWTADRDIDLTSPNIERILISFCRKWRIN